MRYRTLGKTGLEVSEIGFGPEWMDGTPEQTREIAEVLREAGVNYMDCWMADPHIRENLGFAMRGHTDEWIVQGHIGSCWVDGQYKRSRDVSLVRPAFEDELRLLGVEHFEIGMMHYIDSVDELIDSLEGPYYGYVQELLRAETIRHVGLSTHNPEVALEAVRRGAVEVIMFSINPAFDLLPPSEDVNDLFGDFADAGEQVEPLRAELYSLCEENDVALTVMKPYAGGRLLNAEQSPFGVALTPVQCIHYCLTRPAVASVLGGYKTVGEAQDALAYEDATDADNNAKLLDLLADVPDDERTARFVCTLVFVDTDDSEIVAHGSCEGKIGYEERGDNGFGYDPLFYADAFDGKLTTAEVPSEQKDAISHRGEALRAFIREFEKRD